MGEEQRNKEVAYARFLDKRFANSYSRGYCSGGTFPPILLDGVLPEDYEAVRSQYKDGEIDWSDSGR